MQLRMSKKMCNKTVVFSGYCSRLLRIIYNIRRFSHLKGHLMLNRKKQDIFNYI